MTIAEGSGDFNPRSREGSDFGQVNIFISQVKFQSTLPRRERQGLPRPYLYGIFISIHAPAKGATKGDIFPLILEGQFQSTLPRRERRVKVSATDDEAPISIHAPAKGATMPPL